MATNSEFTNNLYKLLHEELAKNKNGTDNIIAKSMINHLDNIGMVFDFQNIEFEKKWEPITPKNAKKRHTEALADVKRRIALLQQDEKEYERLLGELK